MRSNYCLVAIYCDFDVKKKLLPLYVIDIATLRPRFAKRNPPRLNDNNISTRIASNKKLLVIFSRQHICPNAILPPFPVFLLWFRRNLDLEVA